MRYWLQPIDILGQRVLGNFRDFVRIIAMVYLSFRATFFEQAQGVRTVFSVVSSQIYFTGWQAMPLISILGMAAGGIVIMQTSANLNFLGGEQMIGNLLIALVVRELAPLLTALLVVARSGTAVASELGNMRVNREIDALESMGINPLSYIVFPRIVGGIISVFCLALYFVFIALLGGFVISKLVHDMSFRFYLDSLLRAVASEDILLFLLKISFSGLIIFVVSCDQGLSVRRSPTEVPVATTSAVVKSIIYVIFFNLSVTAVFYFFTLKKLGIL